MANYVSRINPHKVRVPKVIRDALNKFFTNHPEMVDECTLREQWDCTAKVCLIFEGSNLYYHLNGYANTWDVHTEFYDAFNGTGYYFEMINSCVLGFYKV